MKETLRDLIRRVLSGSALFTGVSTPVGATIVDHRAVEVPLPTTEVDASAPTDVVVVRERRPRLVLKRASETVMELISSHRSHRSHSSHRSHYSSSGGGGGGGSSRPAAPPRTTTTPSAPRPLMSASGDSVGATLGSRTLVLGMRGADVMHAMRLLVVH